MDCVAIHTNLRYLRMENFVSQRAISDHPNLTLASSSLTWSERPFSRATRVVSIVIVPNNTRTLCRFSYLIYMMNAFHLLRNKTYHEHSLTSVIQDTRTLVMDVWQELEWTDPRLTWDDEPQNLRLPMSKIWTPDIVLYSR